MSKEMTGAEMVVEALKDHGVDILFGYPGGAVLPIYDVLFQQEAVQHILVRHEQGAAHAAEGYARSTGKVGVAARHLRARRHQHGDRPDRRPDGFSIPLVCITGQVPTHLIGSDAFQECDTVGITRHCTKHNYLVKSIDDLPPRAARGVLCRDATDGPARSWSISPRTCNSRAASILRRTMCITRPISRRSDGDMTSISEAVQMMAAAKQPVFYTGGGVINSGPVASTLLRELVRADRLSDHLDADGARRLSRLGPAIGWACSACTARSRPTTPCTTAI